MSTVMLYLAAILGISVVVVIHETGHYLAARFFGMRVLRYSLGLGPVIAKYQPKGSDTIFQISAIPVLAYVMIDGMNPLEEPDPNDAALFANKSTFARMVTIFAGSFANYLGAVVLTFGLVYFGGMPDPDPNALLEVGAVTSNSPAAEAGVLPGDLLVSVEGQEFRDTTTLIAFTRPRANVPTTYVIRRGGEDMSLVITPALSDGRGVIGIQPQPQVTRYRDSTLGEASLLAVQYPVAITVGTVQAIGQMFRRASLDGLSGPVGMTQAVAHQARRGVRNYLEMLISISVALGFFNLLPIPALDGGRLMFLLIGLISRRKMSGQIEAVATVVGLVFVLGLLVVATYGEIAG